MLLTANTPVHRDNIHMFWTLGEGPNPDRSTTLGKCERQGAFFHVWVPAKIYPATPMSPHDYVSTVVVQHRKGKVMGLTTSNYWTPESLQQAGIEFDGGLV